MALYVVLYIFTSPSIKNLQLLRHSENQIFTADPIFFSVNDGRENVAQGWSVIYNMHHMICLDNENRALF